MNKKEITLIGLVVIFIFLVVYIPHYVNPYPVHIDEWHHLTQSQKIINNEYKFGGITTEAGFHFFLAFISIFVDLVLFYQFLPAIWAILTALILFFIVYKKTSNNFYIALFSMLFYASIKTNVNIGGLWFFTPLTFALPFIFLYVYFFTEGIERKNNKFILISLGIMTLLLPVHAISVTFAIPFLLIYAIINYKTVKKLYLSFIPFLILPLFSIIFYSKLFKTTLIQSIPKIINQLQFKYGWGVLELNNSPLELYSLLGYIFAIIGIISIFLIIKNKKKFIPYLLWPASLIIMIIIFKLTDVSYLSPFQRNLYYLTISIPIFSAIGLYYTIKFLNIHINRIDIKEKYIPILKTIINILIITIIFIFIFKAYFDIPKHTLLYKLIDNNDYKALKYLKQFPKSTVLAKPGISEAIYPISGHDLVAGIFFYHQDRKDEVNKFFKNQTSCEDKQKTIEKFKVSYIIAKDEINCTYQMIFNKSSKNKSTYIYEIIDTKQS
ncbi:hypothetical protein GOV12_04895 [Candidatus Pacearchaeota archaeon]|nr:hypothetical protein [Candidatus Pacearchaeota archaeon]